MSKLPHKMGWTIVHLLLALFLVACQEKEPQIPVVVTKIPVEIAAPESIAVNSRTGYVYIINRGNQVGVLKDSEQVALLETGTDLFVEPNDLTVDEERNWVYVVNKYGNSIAVIRDTGIVAIIEAAGREPRRVTVEPNSGWAYVVGPYRKEPPLGEQPVVEGHVTVLNGPELVGTIFLGDLDVRQVVADPVNGYVYVAGSQLTNGSQMENPSKGVVVVIKGLEEIARYETNSPPQSGDHVMDVDQKTGDVFLIDNETIVQFSEGELSRTISIMDQGYIRNLRVHPETGDIYLVAWGEQTEVIIVREKDVVAKIPIEGTALKMAIDPVTGNVYVADFWFNTVTVIHGTEVIATLETGLYPYGIAVNSANGQVYISNTNEGTVTVLGFQD
jgi:DNA-binding beta-propeller fold protein YncE